MKHRSSRHTALAISLGPVVALMLACGSSDSSNGSPTTSASSSADSACEAAKNRTLECQSDAAGGKTGETHCLAVRCMWVNFRDAPSLSESMSKRECKEDIDDFLEVSIQAHINDSGVRDFITECTAKASKPLAEGGCNDPKATISFNGRCDYFAAMNDAARTSFNGCLSKPTCAELNACYAAIFATCGNWR